MTRRLPRKRTYIIMLYYNGVEVIHDVRYKKQYISNGFFNSYSFYFIFFYVIQATY